MLHRVKKPFPYAKNGIEAIMMKVGDEADFHECAPGLEKEGLIEAADSGKKIEQKTPEQEPAEQSQEEPKPRRGRPKSADK